MKVSALAAALAVLAALDCGTQKPADRSTTVANQAAATPQQVVLETSRGTIVLELDQQRAPKSVANFLLLVRGRFYDGLVFHRVKPDFMVQAGYVTADMRRRATTRPPIYNEADNGLRNLRGTLAMARTSYPHSATTEFFINVVDNPKLDYSAPTDAGYGYAVFGRVVEGMDVVDAIAATPTTRREDFADWPSQPVTIRRAFLRGPSP